MFETTQDEARRLGATMLFGEKYGDIVRVVEIDDYSRELCGGTHTALDGRGRVVPRRCARASVAQGVRRIEAVTGPGAIELLRATRPAQPSRRPAPRAPRWSSSRRSSRSSRAACASSRRPPARGGGGQRRGRPAGAQRRAPSSRGSLRGARRRGADGHAGRRAARAGGPAEGCARPERGRARIAPTTPGRCSSSRASRPRRSTLGLSAAVAIRAAAEIVGGRWRRAAIDGPRRWEGRSPPRRGSRRRARRPPERA